MFSCESDSGQPIGLALALHLHPFRAGKLPELGVGQLPIADLPGYLPQCAELFASLIPADARLQIPEICHGA